MTLTATRFVLTGWLLAAAALITCGLSPATTYATKYGAGSYGRCQYATCAISLASSNSVAVNILPVSGNTRCSVASDNVTVTTSSSTGYSLTLIDGDTANTLASGGQTIAASPGTYTNPVTLTANTWGYRIDGAGGFGAGPTSAVTNAAIPTVPFAGIQPNSGTADRIINSAVAATNGATAKVWYGVCVNVSQASGTYTDSVLYTTVVN